MQAYGFQLAQIYGNEKEVGEALRESNVPREDLFVCSKLWNSYHRPEDVEPILRETLASLQVSYLDLFLMHWPVSFGRAPDGSIAKTPKDANGKVILDKALCEDQLPTWRAMEEMVNKGLCRHIGVSNFNIRRCEQLLKGAKIKPIVNQVELNFSNPQPELLAWSKEAGILLESYSPLGSTGAKEREHPEVSRVKVVDIGAKLNRKFTIKFTFAKFRSRSWQKSTVLIRQTSSYPGRSSEGCVKPTESLSTVLKSDLLLI